MRKVKANAEDKDMWDIWQQSFVSKKAYNNDQVFL